ncbi:MAG: hypothetical protein QM683_11720 [Lacrimispora sp.]
MKSLLHYPSRKKRIASWIIGNMPEHDAKNNKGDLNLPCVTG